MSIDRYASLCERILAHCRQKNWYGSDLPMQGCIGAYYEQGTLQSRMLTHNARTGFEFPPVTEEQLRRTEDTMGFAHPPLLRTLYLQLANGGFGPGNGITGAFGGYCYWVERDVRYNEIQRESYLRKYGPKVYADGSHFFEEGSFDLEQYEQRYDDPKLIHLGPHAWPTHFLHLCGWGCTESSYLHGKSGRVYLVSPEDGVTVESEEGFTLLYRQADSLEEWLERWLQGEEQTWDAKVLETLRQEESRLEPDEDYRGEWADDFFD
jgi:hypothetical protein